MNLVSKTVKFGAVVAFAAVIAACGSDKKGNGVSGGGNATIPDAGGVAPAGLYGTWLLPEQRDGSSTFAFQLYIESGRITSRVTCTSGGESATVSASAPARITSNTITVTDTQTREVKRGDVTCTTTIHTGSVNYRVNGNSLTLQSSEGEHLLQRLGSSSSASSSVANFPGSEFSTVSSSPSPLAIPGFVTGAVSSNQTMAE